jgi:hypothetical protein
MISVVLPHSFQLCQGGVGALFVRSQGLGVCVRRCVEGRLGRGGAATAGLSLVMPCVAIDVVLVSGSDAGQLARVMLWYTAACHKEGIWVVDE